MTPLPALAVTLLGALIIFIVGRLRERCTPKFNMYYVTRKFDGLPPQKRERKNEILISPGQHILNVMVIPKTTRTIRTINFRFALRRRARLGHPPDDVDPSIIRVVDIYDYNVLQREPQPQSAQSLVCERHGPGIQATYSTDIHRPKRHPLALIVHVDASCHDHWRGYLSFLDRGDNSGVRLPIQIDPHLPQGQIAW
jgi:hypothetical protein